MAEINKKAKYSEVLVRPMVTEKVSKVMESNVYVFEVSKDSNKTSISEAVQAFYGVKPKKIGIVVTSGKKVFVRGKRGVQADVKKAYVYLKKGDTINLE